MVGSFRQISSSTLQAQVKLSTCVSAEISATEMISCRGKRIFLFDVKYEYLGPLFKPRSTSLTAYYLETVVMTTTNTA